MRIGTSEGCLHDILLSSICFVLVLSMVAGENLTNYRQKKRQSGFDNSTERWYNGNSKQDKNLQHSGSGNHE